MSNNRRNPNTPLSTGEYPEWPSYSLPEQDFKVLSLTMDNDRALRMDACAFWLRYVPELYMNGESNESKKKKKSLKKYLTQIHHHD